MSNGNGNGGGSNIQAAIQKNIAERLGSLQLEVEQLKAIVAEQHKMLQEAQKSKAEAAPEKGADLFEAEAAVAS